MTKAQLLSSFFVVSFLVTSSFKTASLAEKIFIFILTNLLCLFFVWFRTMSKSAKCYFVAAGIVSFLIVFNWGFSGEGGISTFLVTMFLTFPVGVLLGYVYSFLEINNQIYENLTFMPLAIILNYFQWKYFIFIYKKWKGRFTTMV